MKHPSLAGGKNMKYPSSIIMRISKKGAQIVEQSEEEKQKRIQEYNEAMENFQRAIVSVDEMDAAVKFTQDLINKDL